jgi:hypothetical protein
MSHRDYGSHNPPKKRFIQAKHTNGILHFSHVSDFALMSRRSGHGAIEVRAVEVRLSKAEGDDLVSGTNGLGGGPAVPVAPLAGILRPPRVDGDGLRRSLTLPGGEQVGNLNVHGHGHRMSDLDLDGDSHGHRNRGGDRDGSWDRDPVRDGVGDLNRDRVGDLNLDGHLHRLVRDRDGVSDTVGDRDGLSNSLGDGDGHGDADGDANGDLVWDGDTNGDTDRNRDANVLRDGNAVRDLDGGTVEGNSVPHELVVVSAHHSGGVRTTAEEDAHVSGGVKEFMALVC